MARTCKSNRLVIDGVSIEELVQCRKVLAQVPARSHRAHLRFGQDVLSFERRDGADTWVLDAVSTA